MDIRFFSYIFVASRVPAAAVVFREGALVSYYGTRRYRVVSYLGRAVSIDFGRPYHLVCCLAGQAKEEKEGWLPLPFQSQDVLSER